MEEMQSIQKSKSERLEKRTVVITGASSGIGRAASIEFARRNYHVVAVARNEKSLKELAGECE